MRPRTQKQTDRQPSSQKNTERDAQGVGEWDEIWGEGEERAEDKSKQNEGGVEGFDQQKRVEGGQE